MICIWKVVYQIFKNSVVVLAKRYFGKKNYFTFGKYKKVTNCYNITPFFFVNNPFLTLAPKIV